MKNTQKKLKAKHFRYLNKEYVKDPNKFLDFFAGSAYNWEKYFYHLIVSHVDSKCSTYAYFNYGEALCYLGRSIECGYLIIQKTNISPSTENGVYAFETKNDFSNYAYKDGVDSEKVLSNFFGYKTLKQWYDFLDTVLLSFGHKNKVSALWPSDKMTADIFQTLAHIEQLTIALYNIDFNGGLTYKVSKDRPLQHKIQI